jgi:hypothetical protein
MRGALLSLALLLPLAGCVGTEPEPEALATLPPVEEAAPSPATTGAPEPQEGPASPPDHVDLMANATPVTTPIAWDGSLDAAACVPTGPGTCLPPVPHTDDDRVNLEFPGVPQTLSASVTWTASSPLTESLYAGVALMKSCGEGCREFAPVGDAVQGASPLALDADLPTPGPDETLVILVWQPPFLPSPLHGYARAEQAFHVEGTVTSLA